MNSIKFFFILGAVFFTPALRGQASINPAIQTTLDAFIEYSNQQDWDKAFDLLYPKLFTKVPKQDLVDVMMGMEADGMTLHMGSPRITSTSVPVVEGDETFVRVEYDANMDVNIKPGGMYDYQKAVISITEQFEATYGASNVKWNADNKRFEIAAHKSMIAVQTGTGSWKLVEINMDQPELMAYLFSPSVMETLVRKQ
jgi:hypothetical protein